MRLGDRVKINTVYNTLSNCELNFERNKSLLKKVIEITLKSESPFKRMILPLKG